MGTSLQRHQTRSCLHAFLRTWYESGVNTRVGDSRITKTSVRPQVASSVLEATAYTDNSVLLQLGQGLGGRRRLGK